MDVPVNLRRWFLAHFLVDVILGIPLFLFPNQFLGLMGFEIGEPLIARLVGAALLGIGGASFMVRKKHMEAFEALLDLKIIWSVLGIVALLISLFLGGPSIGWLFVIVFLVFNVVWIHYRLNIGGGI